MSNINITEDTVAVNNVGSGCVAGVGVTNPNLPNQAEPGVNKKRKRKVILGSEKRVNENTETFSASDMVAAAMNSDYTNFKEMFSTALSDKIADAISAQRIEVSTKMFNGEK